MRSQRVAAAFQPPAAGGAAALAFPGFAETEGENRKRTVVTGSLAAGLHLGILGFLVLMASLAPMIEEEILPVQLLRDEPPPREEPAPAKKALAERRMLNYAPAVQAIQPQIVNPRVVADATPVIDAKALQMDAVSSVAAPTQISRATTVVERVSAVNSIASARVSAVDVSQVGGAAVRGPVRAVGPVGPSVGPRQVVAATGTSSGTGKLVIGGGSSVREGILSNRDVAGSPDGAPLANVDTAIGEGMLRGSGGTGSSIEPAGSGAACFERPEVNAYLGQVQKRVLERWVLPPSVTSDQRVTLSFRLDVAGSATRVSLVKASDNALGASAIDALRSAAPFPPMPEGARCLASTPITGTFTNPVDG
jgi:TonB family protein